MKLCRALHSAAGRALWAPLAVFAFVAGFPAPAAAQWGWGSGGAGGWQSSAPSARTPAAPARQRSAPQFYANQQDPPRAQYRAQQQYVPPQQYQQAYGAYYQPSQQSYWGQPSAPPTLAYAPPSAPRKARPSSAARPVKADRSDDDEEAKSGLGGGAFCVRLCDGRFFPIGETGNSTPKKMCGALCPATRTKVFEGAAIDDAVADDGARYEKLATAFLFRKEVVDKCTCNGKDPFGLAKIDPAADPTLRGGDVVATAQGLKVFTGSYSARSGAARFTPIERSSLVSGDLRRRLRKIKIANR